MTSKLAEIRESATIRIADIARRLEQQGKKVIKLQTGDPDFDTPNVIIEAAYSALKTGYTHYSDSRGMPDLRIAISEKLLNDNGLSYDPAHEILVTHGGIHAIFITINTLIEAGDEVLIPDPCWMPYVSSTRIAGGIPVRIPTDSENNFEMLIGNIEAAISKKSKLIILNTPCNPSGKVLTHNEMAKIGEIAEKYNLHVISDEVYEKLIYDRHRHISFASLPGMKERTITVNSFSKTYAMTGWRIGYLAAQKELVSQILKMSQYTITNVAPFIQKAGIEALTNPEVNLFVSTMKNTYESRRNRMAKNLSGINGIRTVIPQGAFYFMVDISHYNRDSSAFSEDLLEREFVGVVPGASFGQCAEGFIRLTFAASENQTMEGIARLEKMLKNEYA